MYLPMYKRFEYFERSLRIYNDENCTTYITIGELINLSTT